MCVTLDNLCDGAGTAPRPPTLGPCTPRRSIRDASTHAVHADGTPLMRTTVNDDTTPTTCGVSLAAPSPTLRVRRS